MNSINCANASLVVFYYTQLQSKLILSTQEVINHGKSPGLDKSVRDKLASGSVKSLQMIVG